MKQEPTLAYEDPDTANAVNILEILWIDKWESVTITPRIEGKTVFSWYENAINHLLDRGSIRQVEVFYNA